MKFLFFFYFTLFFTLQSFAMNCDNYFSETRQLDSQKKLEKLLSIFLNDDLQLQNKKNLVLILKSERLSSESTAVFSEEPPIDYRKRMISLSKQTKEETILAFKRFLNKIGSEVVVIAEAQNLTALYVQGTYEEFKFVLDQELQRQQIFIERILAP